MFISELIHTLNRYDQYGLHRFNGVKVVYLLLVAFTANYFMCIENAFFYFFYVPVTAMLAEMLVFNVLEKYKLFIYATLGACGMIFIFNLLKPYPLFFLLFGFVGPYGLYLFVLKHNRARLVLVPIILSLASYSLLYFRANVDFNAVLNNAITTLMALIIMLGALILLPLSYYYRLWLRAFYLLTKECQGNLMACQHQAKVGELIHGHMLHLVRFSHMLPRQFPTFSILKLNLLINQLHLMTGFVKPHHKNSPLLIHLNAHLEHLLLAIKHERPCGLLQPFKHGHHADLAPLEKTLSTMMSTWNQLCGRL